MAEFSYNEIAAILGCSAPKDGSRFFTGISTDTRTIKSGNLYVALRGERFDGHDFIETAINNGASGVVLSQDREIASPNVAVFLVQDTLKAYQAIASFHRQRFNIPVIGITGSNGKTTTKDMTSAVLSEAYRVLKTEENYNNEIGLPLTLLNLTSEHTAAVVEMGMRGFGEIKLLAEIAFPTIAIVTNVGETHVERLGSIEGIAKAKGELVESLPDSGLVILNADDPHVLAMRRLTKARVVTYGIENNEADIKADNIKYTAEGIAFTLSSSGETYMVEIPAFGKHNVYNALAALAAGLNVGMNFAAMQTGLKKFLSGKMRLHIEKVKGFLFINDAYNASPLSMTAAIDTLGSVASGRKVAVLGDMLELGHMAATAHQAVGCQLAEAGVAVVITVGELAQNIAQKAKECGVKTVVACSTHEMACLALKEYILPGDSVLIKGSRGMQMEKILEKFAQD